jgi:hypothetical protein
MFLNQKRIKESLHEKNLRIHGNLWKFYSLSLLLGIIAVSIKGMN